MGIRCAPAMKLDAELLVTQAGEGEERGGEGEMKMRRRQMKRDECLLWDLSALRSFGDFRQDLRNTQIHDMKSSRLSYEMIREWRLTS